MLMKRPASAEINETSEPKVLNVRELIRETPPAKPESTDGETSDNLRSLLGRVSESSTREVDNLIDELQRVREKLRDDGERIQRDMEEYAALNQQVINLANIISESLRNLPNASPIHALKDQRGQWR